MPATDPPGEQRRLCEFGDSGRCHEVAVSTGERCERDAVGGTGYCPLHLPRQDLAPDGTDPGTSNGGHTPLSGDCPETDG